MPDPSSYDSESEFMEACVPTMVDEGRDQDQAVAACLSMWRERSVGQTMQRAYSVLTVKSVDNERREIEGTASTPEVDRVGDIIEPMGAKFSLPMPLLWQHRHDEPVGHVTVAKASKSGITVKAKLAKIDEPGELKNLVDKAWQAVKAGLVRGLSIGFKANEFELLDTKDPFGGLRFTDWSWIELSLVTIPANQSASISVIRSLDQGLQAAPGQAEDAGIRPSNGGAPKGRRDVPSPDASGKQHPVNLKLKERRMSKTVQEHISALEAKRAANQARMEEIMAKAMEEGRSTDETEREEFDTLEREVETIDDDLTRFRSLQEKMVATAKPVTSATTKTMEDGSAARAGMIRVREPELPKGVRFARVARCLGLAQGNRGQALELAEKLYADDRSTIVTLQAAARYGEVSDLAVKAPVPAASTTDTQWAGALVTAVSGEAGVVGDFLEFLRPMTILGKFGTNGIPGLRRVPFRTGLVTQHTGGSGYWVGEGAPKPVTKIDFARRTLLPTKVANIAVVSEELLRDGSSSADVLIRDALAGALRERLDSDFVDPAITASGARPASITSGATAITSASAGGSAGGGPAASVRTDVRAIMSGFINADNSPTSGVWIMRSTTALNLSMMTNALGESEDFARNITMNGGTFFGLPVIVSEYVPAVGSPTGDYVILVNTSDVWFADEGGISIDMSREASIEMDDNPTGAAFTGSPGSVTGLSTTSLVSLWQQNCVGFRAERTVNWAVARPSGVQVLASVNWGE